MKRRENNGTLDKRLLFAIVAVIAFWRSFHSKSVSFVKYCGDCGAHGSCLIDRCYCDAGFQGVLCNETKVCDTDICDGITTPIGRFRVSKHDASSSSSCDHSEFDFWEPTSIPNPMQDQVFCFKNFWSLPDSLGHVVEVGAGPYTTTRLLLETRPALSVSQLTLVDPLEYDSSRYRGTSFTAEGHLKVRSRMVLTRRFFSNHHHHDEKPSFPAADTVILVNALWNVTNAIDTLHKAYGALKPGGILVFGQSFATEADLRHEIPKCLPIQLRKEFLLAYLDQYFDSTALLPPVIGDSLSVVEHEGVKQMVFAIARKTL